MRLRVFKAPKPRPRSKHRLSRISSSRVEDIKDGLRKANEGKKLRELNDNPSSRFFGETKVVILDTKLVVPNWKRAMFGKAIYYD